MDVVGAIEERRGEEWRVGVKVATRRQFGAWRETIGLDFGYI